ncbi:Stk1 family PASTA domain-containing Ser/Thr kinase [Ornithinibacillus halophilus]|uniref:Serine/threonine-protein kinase PrkC n=1 Tax=Ornithinibacillus halophilus TaxID=930117 RepID=A0A1M5C6Q3_9BACI|nr:Stk1 family PASTA domain-containing Ser/Thr kinase [Ornithinibacillus halophilus]SHF50405.1 serine/threonine protein kinase [Ornithinibacillus halophilus]
MLNGHILNERYRIKEKIGGGGMADVYLAKDIILDRDVAIKVLRLEYANDDEFIARFDREAQSATSLSHQNIVNIYDVGEEDQILFMAMEFVDGMTLKEYIQRFGPIDVPEAIDIMKQITSAITHAHENGIVHRDIKPQNILIDSYGHIKVTDFGIAVALSATSLTQTNSVLGSVHYLSPEQARGGLATKKSDIYSLGIVFFELLTGRLPFSGQSPVSIALKHLQSDTPSVRRFSPNVPQSVENIVLKATAKDPFHRFNTVYEMEQNLENALNPDRLNEEKYTPPIEVGEETKAIPIITDNQSIENVHQDTIVHDTQSETKKVGNNHSENHNPIEKKKKRNRNLLITFIVLFVLLGAGLAALFIFPSLLKPDEVTIPDVTEWEYDEALAELEQLNLEVIRETKFDEEIPEGYVIETDPRDGRTVVENSTVTVFVSDGKETEPFDDYEGMDIDQVEAILETKGYTEVEVNYKEDSDYEEGSIIRQITPKAGSDVVPSETRVVFEVSSGPEQIKLNSLRNMTEEEVKEYLDEYGLKMKKHEENSDTVNEGLVIRHEPGVNESVEKGATIDVYFSIGPEPLPPRTVIIGFTVHYEEQPDDSGDGDGDGDGEDEGENLAVEPEPQEILIYVDDLERDPDVPIQDPYYLTKEEGSKEFRIQLTIGPDTVAHYRVTRDGEEVEYEEISYEQVTN